MALPSYDEIAQYFRNGQWTEMMLRTALVCKAITKEQYDALIAEKASQN